MGVFVATFKNSVFPAFFSSSSGFKSPYSFETPKEAAEIFCINYFSYLTL